MKLQVIELKETDIEEVANGEFQEVTLSVEKRPLLFNHRALLLAKREGILETGLEQELFLILHALGPDVLKSEDDDLGAADVLKISAIITLDHMKDLIWCAYVGAIRDGVHHDRDEFKELYDVGFTETLQTFIALLQSSVSKEKPKNKFAADLNKFENKSKSGKKSNSSQA